MSDKAPSPQSVVVPDLAVAVERLTTLGDAFELWGAHGGNLISEDQALPMSRHIKLVLDALAAAPAPSSLAGGEVPAAAKRLGADLDEGRIKDLAVSRDVAIVLAALSPEAPVRERVRVSDLVRRIKYQVECSSGNLIKSGADSDMVRICLSHFNDLADEVATLTPRHEAPADRHERNLTAGNSELIEQALSHPPLEAPSPRPELAPYIEDLKGITAAMLADEAPAEGAGEIEAWIKRALIYIDQCVGAGEIHFPGIEDDPADLAGKGFMLFGLGDECDAAAIPSAFLRARSSAPEARDGRTHPTGEAIQDALIAGFLHGVGMGPWDDMHDYIAVCARDYAKGDPLPVRTAAPSADKLQTAVEALEPFARLELPKKPVGNAGAWSLLLSDIRRAKEALAALKAEV